MRIFILSEELNEPFDEGIKNFAFSLVKALSGNNQVSSISICRKKMDDGTIRKLKVNRAFLSYKLSHEIRDFNPDAVIYVPSPSITFFSFLRSKVLKFCARHASVVMIGLQPRKYSSISKKLVRLMVPDLLLVQSQNVLETLHDLGCHGKFLPSGVDTERFHPVNPERKLELKEKYRVDPGNSLVLHVGHINRNRNVQSLKNIQGNGTQVLLVGSTSTQQDEDLVNELRATGVKVITEYIDHIEEVYQAADCYVFQVTSTTGSIEVPLSVLEAMACNLPVVTTRYGGLPTLFKEGKGLFFVNNANMIPEKIVSARQFDPVRTRSIVQPFSWETVAGKIIEELGKPLQKA